MDVIKDEELLKIAKKRVSFKKHLVSYVIINGFLWALWFVTGGHADLDNFYLAWPIWSTLGWGIGLAFNYFDAYHNLSSSTAVQREYEKLKNEGH
jgi:2TM domain